MTVAVTQHSTLRTLPQATMALFMWYPDQQEERSVIQSSFPHAAMPFSLYARDMFYFEVQGYKHDAKFIRDNGVIADRFTIIQQTGNQTTLTQASGPLICNCVTTKVYPAIIKSGAAVTISGELNGKHHLVVTDLNGPVLHKKEFTGKSA